jgi:glycosyltransferase involved in cell wall biosynthesis
MKVLHLLSNWKWTERSEPAADLAVAEKELGTRIWFACGNSPQDTKDDVASHATRKGLVVVDGFELPKHFKFGATWRDLNRLKKLIARHQMDILHCHLSNAHLISALADRLTGGVHRKPLIVRSNYDPEGRIENLKNRLLYRYAADGIVAINQKAKDCLLKQTALNASAVSIAEPGIDLERFSPTREITDDHFSASLQEEFFVIGVVSRIRESRRIDIVLAALKALAKDYPHMRMLLIGRGSAGAVQSVIEIPAEKMGIRDRIILAGYCREDRLVAGYRAMDVLVYPTPGTDKTCRTVREAMAAGVPVIAPYIGFLPELIEDGYNGRLMKMTAQNLAEILSELIENRDRLQKMGRYALKTANIRFSRRLQAQKALSLYDRLLRAKRPG